MPLPPPRLVPGPVENNALLFSEVATFLREANTIPAQRPHTVGGRTHVQPAPISPQDMVIREPLAREALRNRNSTRRGQLHVSSIDVDNRQWVRRSVALERFEQSKEGKKVRELKQQFSRPLTSLRPFRGRDSVPHEHPKTQQQEPMHVLDQRKLSPQKRSVGRLGMIRTPKKLHSPLRRRKSSSVSTGSSSTLPVQNELEFKSTRMRMSPQRHKSRLLHIPVPSFQRGVSYLPASES